MKYKVLKNRHVPNVGVFNAGEDRDVADDAVAQDLLAQGVIEKPSATPKLVKEEETE